MALFPEVGVTFYSEKDNFIKKRMESAYSESLSLNQMYWAEADLDTRFEAGDQSVWGEIYGYFTPVNQKQFNFNRIRRIINMITGYQRRNRMSTNIIPVENADDETSSDYTKLIMWNDQAENVPGTISQAFHGGCVTGMNLLQVWLDYRNDPISGDIKVDNCSYNSFLIDPFFKKQDLSDCNYLWKRSWLTKYECLALLPDFKDQIEELSKAAVKDDKFQFMPENYTFKETDLLIYDEFYYKDTRPQKLLIDVQSGESMEWRMKGKNKQGEDSDEALRLFLDTYPQVIIRETEIPTTRVAVVVQGKVLYDGLNPMGIDRYPFVPVLGYYRPQMPYFSSRLQGVVRGLRDAQFLYNRRKVIELDILESNLNSGWIYKENALVNPKDVFMTGQGKGLALKAEAQMTDVQRIQAATIDPALLQLSEAIGRELQEISGVNDELLGSAIDEKAGILSMLRQGAALTTLQDLFDNLDFAQALLGKIRLEIIQSNFTPGKVKRVLGKEPQPQFYDKAFGKYDAAVTEGFNTTTQRQLQFAQLIQLRELGVAIPDEVLVDAITVQDKDKLVDAIRAQNEQQQQMQQMQLQSALQEEAARTELAKARAVADEGLGVERLSRVQENEQLAVERQEEAKKDRTEALLNIVKALQEINLADINQLQTLLQLSQQLNSNAVGGTNSNAVGGTNSNQMEENNV